MNLEQAEAIPSIEVITLDDLAASFPSCFFVRHDLRRPLKIGICADLLPLVSCSEDELKALLRKYTSSDGYFFASTEGAIRIDVNGNAAGTVEAKHAAYARKVLSDRERWRAKQQRKQEAREHEAAAQRKVPKHDAPSISSACEQPRHTPPRGDGFAALRAAAARRKEAAA